jgi:hypothetical protein
MGHMITYEVSRPGKKKPAESLRLPREVWRGILLDDHSQNGQFQKPGRRNPMPRPQGRL